MTNNYLHDVATAILLVSAVMLFVLARRAARDGYIPGVTAYFLEAYRKLNILMAASLAWIFLGGVVRTLAYRQYEWLPAAGRGQVPVLIIKHILIFLTLAAGIHFWLKVRATARDLKKRIEKQ